MKKRNSLKDLKMVKTEENKDTTTEKKGIMTNMKKKKNH